MFIEGLNALKLIVTGAEIGQRVTPKILAILERIRKEKLKIVIVGRGGNGKTTLAKLLSGSYRLEEILGLYEESLDIESYRINKDANITGEIITVPGQYRRETWNNLLEEITAGKYNLIIHVISYGYHSISQVDVLDHPIYQNNMSIENFMDEYKKDRRKAEIISLKDLATQIKICSKKITLISLVTKQDLWWNERTEVREHYKRGEYDNLIENIKRSKSEESFQHEYISTSLIIQNMYSPGEEILAQTSAGYDQILRVANMVKFINKIERTYNANLEVTKEWMRK